MTEASRNGDKKRTIYFDYLRVAATLAVMILHISAQNWNTTNVNGFEWQVFNFFDSIVRWAVPIFVMISGALFLNKAIPLIKLYSKYILRMVIAFIFWSGIYALFENGPLLKKAAALIQGHYHMWFIFMIIGLYMCVPFIKVIVEEEVRIKYFLLLALIFAYFIPEIQILADDFGNELIIKGVSAIHRDANQLSIHMVLGYISYFVLGFYLNGITINRTQRIIIYILGLFGFAFTVGISLAASLKMQAPCIHYYGDLTVNVLLEAVAVFTWSKYRKFDNERLNSFVQRLAEYSFGAYLVHALIIEQLNERLGMNTLSFNPILAVICIGAIVFIVSFEISAILNHVPVVKKYMV